MKASSQNSAMLRGNYTDAPCWYVVAKWRDRTALLLGPYPDTDDGRSQCRVWVDRKSAKSRNKFAELFSAVGAMDGAAAQYTYGVAKLVNGYREGRLNEQFGY